MGLGHALGLLLGEINQSLMWWLLGLDGHLHSHVGLGDGNVAFRGLQQIRSGTDDLSVLRIIVVVRVGRCGRSGLLGAGGGWPV